MKRFTTILICVLLLAAVMILPVSAEGSPAAALTGASGTPGSAANLTLSLSGFEDATSIAISVSPEAGLTMDAENSRWLISGVMSSMDANRGVWAANGAVSINGSVASLAFTVPTPTAGQTDMNYGVSCTVQAMYADGTTATAHAYANVSIYNPATGLTLDKTSLALDMKNGTTASLSATVTPSNTSDFVVWSSSDSSVASVSNGAITAKKPGTATITATAGSVSASCTVTVTCTHNLETHAANAPTCKTTGNNLYYTCSACGVVLDANMAVTTVQAQTLSTIDHNGGTATCTEKAVCSMCAQPYGSTLPHPYATTWSYDENNHWHKCTTNGCPAELGKAQHSFTWVVDKAATEDETGLKHEECTCGYKRNENTVISKQDHVHVGIQHHTAVPATCISAGTVEYWTCSSNKCAGKYYGDAACQVPLTTIVDPINKDNHTGQTELKDKEDPTCSVSGYSGDLWCTSCNTMIQEGKDLKPTGNHTPKQEYGRDGLFHWQICSNCECIIGNVMVEHTFTWVVDKKPTETTTGIKHQECTVCGYKASLNTVAEKLKHTPVRVAAIAPTCEKEGMVEHYHCENCGDYYLSTNGKIGKWVKKSDLVQPATGHTFFEEWTSDEKGHWHSCECGEKQDATAHELQLVGAVEATETDPGYTGDEICAVCGYVKTSGEEIPCIVVEETTVPETEEVPAESLSEPTESKMASLIPAILLTVVALVAVSVIIFLKKRK